MEEEERKMKKEKQKKGKYNVNFVIDDDEPLFYGSEQFDYNDYDEF